MTSVFIGGSRRLTRLDPALRERVDNIVARGFTILIGDANGADKCVQKYLAEKNYANVIVYHTGDDCRNNLGHWKMDSVVPRSSRKDFEFYAAKDLEMTKEASYGLMLWDGLSKGTLNNIINLLKEKKPVLVYFAPEKQFIALNDIRDLKGILNKCAKKAIASFEKHLHLTEVVNVGQPDLNFA